MGCGVWGMGNGEWGIGHWELGIGNYGAGWTATYRVRLNTHRKNWESPVGRASRLSDAETADRRDALSLRRSFFLGHSNRHYITAILSNVANH